MAHPSHVNIEVFNVLGQHVKTLLDAFQYGSGSVVWNATDDNNRGVASGLYIYSMKAGDVRINKKMLLIDGQMGSTATAAIHSSSVMNNQHFLNKQMSGKYTLSVSGVDIEVYKLENINISADSYIDVSVNRVVRDYDGNVYRTVKIGAQWWMAENLKVTHYRDGTPIPHVPDNTWTILRTGAYCAYNNDENNVATYGLLYNWKAVIDTCIISPEGWHVPTDEEWKQLEKFLGMSESEINNLNYRGTNEGSKLAGNADLWSYGDLEINPAFNESGFFALPGGWRVYSDGDFNDMGIAAVFWSSTLINGYSVWRRAITCDYSSILRSAYVSNNGISIRCVRD